MNRLHFQKVSAKNVITRVTMMLLLSIICSSCYTKSIREQDTKIRNVIIQWGYSIEKLNYSLYAKTLKYPDTKDEFLAEYKDFYYSGLTIVSIEDAEPRIIAGDQYDTVTVSVGAQTLSRDGSLPEGQMHGTIELVKISGSDLEWRIHGKILMRN